MGCSKQTICNARNTLKKRGLIDFKAGIRGKKAPTYSICHLTKELTNDMTDELTNDLTTKLTHIKNKKTTKNKHNINSKREEEKDNSDKQNDMLPSSYDSRKELLADTFWQSEILIKLVSEGFPLDSNSLKNALESFLVYTEKNVVDERESYNCKLHFYNWIKKHIHIFLIMERKTPSMIDAEVLKSVLLRRKNMRNRITLPLTYEDAKQALAISIEVEVMSRHGKFQLSRDVDDQISKMAQWLTQVDKKFGMMLCGGIGNGKTTMMKALQSLLNVMNFKKEQYSLALKIQNTRTIMELYKKDYPNYLNLSRCEMLAIDDMGTEALEFVDYGNIFTPIIDLISTRYEHQSFTIVSTNLTPKQIQERYGDRIADRLNEMMERIVFKNSTFRIDRDF